VWDLKTEELITVQLIGLALFAPRPISPAKWLSQQRERGRKARRRAKSSDQNLNEIR